MFITLKDGERININWISRYGYSDSMKCPAYIDIGAGMIRMSILTKESVEEIDRLIKIARSEIKENE